MKRKNVLFIMCDQLRWDYLSCYGHATLRTPNIDSLAERGLRFDNAYCQSPICGPSRMSTYTGRYVSSHGSHSNFAPLRIGEKNIGHHLNPLGVRTVLVGKTHMKADEEGNQEGRHEREREAEEAQQPEPSAASSNADAPEQAPQQPPPDAIQQ